MPKKKPSYLVEMTGVYWTCWQLCQEGLVPTIPPRNLPYFDIPVTDPFGKSHATVQVKTRTDNQGWMFGWVKDGKLPKLLTRPSHFYVLVDLSAAPVEALVVPSSVANSFAQSRARKWLKKLTRKGTERKGFPVGVDPRGDKDGWAKYRNNWDLLRRSAD